MFFGDSFSAPSVLSFRLKDGSMDATLDIRSENAGTAVTMRSRASDWLWRPWYAKLWWASIPIWWLGMAASTRLPALGSFYDSALAGFLNILFFPMTTLMVLGVGYAQQWLAQFPTPGDGGPLSDRAAAGLAYLEAEEALALEELKASTDIYNPRSGGLYIGTPTSFQHPNRRF